jgi:hypothetical protein
LGGRLDPPPGIATVDATVPTVIVHACPATDSPFDATEVRVPLMLRGAARCAGGRAPFWRLGFRLGALAVRLTSTNPSWCLRRCSVCWLAAGPMIATRSTGGARWLASEVGT